MSTAPEIITNSLVVDYSKNPDLGDAPKPFTQLPDDLQIRILKELSLEDLSHVKTLNQRINYDLTKSDPVWENVADQIGLPLDKRSCISYCDQVTSFTKKLKKTAENKVRYLARSFNELQFPDIQNILATRIPDIDQINVLQRWLIATDTLVVWYIIAQEAGLPEPNFDQIRSAQQAIDFAKTFDSWVNTNELRLSQRITRLSFTALSLTSIPKEIGKLKALKELFLSCNEVKELPKEIGELKALKELDFRDNPIKEVPIEILNLPNLTIYSATTI